MYAKTGDIGGHTLLVILDYLTTTAIRNLTKACSTETLYHNITCLPVHV